MKWFIKALRQYADFSGRARRKEYWYFALFNLIFSIVWTLLMTLLFALTQGWDLGFDRALTYKVLNAEMVASLSYCVVMLLPALAVTIRRLHDTGRSAWWLLMGLVPFIGGIWLFVLMVLNSQPDENRYGSNPKTSPQEICDEKTLLKHAGRVFVVAACAALLAMALQAWIMSTYNTYAFLMEGYMAVLLPKCIILTVFLVGGIFLLRAKTRLALILFLVVASVSFAWYLNGDINFVKSVSPEHWSYFWGNRLWSQFAYFASRSTLSLALAVFAASALFYKAFVRKTAAALMVIAGATLLCWVFFIMNMSGRPFIAWWQQVMPLLDILNVLNPVAIMLLAYAYLSKPQPP